MESGCQEGIHSFLSEASDTGETLRHVWAWYEIIRDPNTRCNCGLLSWRMWVGLSGGKRRRHGTTVGDSLYFPTEPMAG